MKKGAAYLNIWMEVVRELNEAVTGCKGGIDNAVQSVDEAVAFYTGSLTTQENETGILLYALAEVRGNQMRTDMGDKDLGLSYVNVQVMNLFSQLQSIILARDQSVCDKAEETKNSIITLMKVPLVQGLLRYAYIREFQNPVDGETAEVVQAEGATFAATVLPFVYNCDAKAASVIHDNMQMGAQTSFRTVKAALENTYECMRITCQNVGGIWNHTAQSYNEYGSPCGISTQQNSGRSVGSYLGITVGVLLAGWAFIRYRHKFGRKQRKNKSVPYVYTGNIAAVTEIA